MGTSALESSRLSGEAAACRRDQVLFPDQGQGRQDHRDQVLGLKQGRGRAGDRDDDGANGSPSEKSQPKLQAKPEVFACLSACQNPPVL